MNPDKVYLAEHVLGYIEAHPEEHRQAAWRCETGMCFAGHVANFSGMQWLVPAEQMGRKTSHSIELVQDLLITTKETRGSVLLSEALQRYSSRTQDEIRRDLRRIRPDLNLNGIWVISAERYAIYELGLEGGDAMSLFDAGNTVEDLKNGVKILANGKHIRVKYDDSGRRSAITERRFEN